MISCSSFFTHPLGLILIRNKFHCISITFNSSFINVLGFFKFKSIRIYFCCSFMRTRVLYQLEINLNAYVSIITALSHISWVLYQSGINLGIYMYFYSSFTNLLVLTLISNITMCIWLPLNSFSVHLSGLRLIRNLRNAYGHLLAIHFVHLLGIKLSRNKFQLLVIFSDKVNGRGREGS